MKCSLDSSKINLATPTVYKYSAIVQLSLNAHGEKDLSGFIHSFFIVIGQTSVQSKPE